MQVTRLLDLQLVDVAAQPHQLPGQLLVLQAHFCLKKGGKKGFSVVNLLLLCSEAVLDRGEWRGVEVLEAVGLIFLWVCEVLACWQLLL